MQRKKMMQNQRGISLFSSVKAREITASWQVNSVSIKNRTECVLYSLKEKANDKTSVLSACHELKTLALMGSKRATQSYLNTFRLGMLGTKEVFEPLFFAMKEIGILRRNPQMLYCAYRVKTGFDGGAAYLIPDIAEGFECLMSAANMEGDGATEASYTLAYLYSAELGYHFKGMRPFQLCHLTYLYWQFLHALEILEVDKAIHHQTTVSGTITFAKLGCEEAIEKLIFWYESGNDELNIARDLLKKEEWQQFLNHLPAFLQEQFDKHFQLVIANTVQYGYTTVGMPAIDIQYFVDVASRLKFGDDYDRIQSFNDYIEKFISAANAGNAQACFFLGNLSFKGLENFIEPNFSEAKKWYQKILNFNTKLSKIIRFAARNLYEIGKLEGINQNDLNQLLKNAALFECSQSAIDLGEKELESNHLEQAKAYFNQALLHSKSTDVPYTICNILMHALPAYSLQLLEPYYLNVLAVEIKRGSHSGIKHMIAACTDMKHAALIASWSNILISREAQEPISDELVDTLTKQTTEALEAFRMQNEVEYTKVQMRQ